MRTTSFGVRVEHRTPQQLQDCIRQSIGGCRVCQNELDRRTQAAQGGAPAAPDGGTTMPPVSASQFVTGEKVTWWGRVVTIVTLFPATNEATVRKELDGKHVTVDVAELLKMAPMEPVDPIMRSTIAIDVREAILKCREVLRGTNRNQLASLLRGATRGPDDSHHGRKQAGTAKLRTAVWGPAGNAFGDVGTGRIKASELDGSGDHYKRNITGAASLLGILDT
jgi:hypothetical protein